MRFVDSHLHLDAGEESVVSLAKSTQTLLFTCGIDRRSSNGALRLAEAQRETVRAFIGIHPSETLKARGLDWLPGALKRAAGMGEVGLDPRYSGTGPRSAQMKYLLSQLEAAQSASKPVQIHSRNAEQTCLDALGEFSLRAVLMHWLEDETALRAVQGRGYFVSFGPALIYSRKLQRMAARCDHETVLVETDSPVAFKPLGGVHGPSLLPSVVFRLAELWGSRFETVREKVTANALRFLGEKG